MSDPLAGRALALELVRKVLGDLGEARRLVEAQQERLMQIHDDDLAAITETMRNIAFTLPSIRAAELTRQAMEIAMLMEAMKEARAWQTTLTAAMQTDRSSEGGGDA